MKFPEIKKYTECDIDTLIEKLKEEYTEIFAFNFAYKNKNNHICEKEIEETFTGEIMDFIQIINTIAYHLEWRLPKPINSKQCISIDNILNLIELQLSNIDNCDSYDIFRALNDMQDLAYQMLNMIMNELDLKFIDVYSKHVCKLKKRGLKF